MVVYELSSEKFYFECLIDDERVKGGVGEGRKGEGVMQSVIV